MTPHDPDSRFTKEALSRLEASGIPVLHFLNIDIKSFRNFLGFSEPTNYILDNSTLVLDSWLNGSSNVPPTWNKVLLLFRQFNLAKWIETYLSGGTVKEPFEMRESEAVMAGKGERIR